MISADAPFPSGASEADFPDAAEAAPFRKNPATTSRQKPLIT
jgi:hypothetical protein